MKKILIIITIFMLASCGSKTVEDARMVKVGMSTKDLEYYMGKPYEVEINSDGEEWFFQYDGSGKYATVLCVTVVDDKIESFYSY